MGVLDPLFGSEAVTAIFSDDVRLQRMLDFEAALARAEAQTGVIQASAAKAIAEQCRVERLDMPALARAAAEAGNLAIPLVRQLTDLVSQASAEAAHYVHWGATSQDVIDTGLILQVREGLDHIDKDVDELCRTLAELAQRHRETPMVARTWMQHAVPSVFGLKVAGWLDALLRHRERLAQLRARVLVLQFGGAAGTLAALGGKGMAVSEALARELSLDLPDTPWHSQRDRIAEIGTTLALCVGTLGKIARDLVLQSQTEVGELAEPGKAGRGGSSTMPHKQNPVGAAVILAAAERVPALASTLLHAMQQEHERGLGNWHAEWETLPEIFRLTAGALGRTLTITAGLQVHPDAMRQNLDKSGGLIFAEAVSMALAGRVGRAEAHSMVEAASRRAVTEKKHLRDVLAADPKVREALDDKALDGLFESAAYTGEAGHFIERVLARSRRPHAAGKL